MYVHIEKCKQKVEAFILCRCSQPKETWFFYQPLTNFRIVACEKSKTDVVLCVVKVKVQEEMKFLFLQL